APRIIVDEEAVSGLARAAGAVDVGIEDAEVIPRDIAAETIDLAHGLAASGVIAPWVGVNAGAISGVQSAAQAHRDRFIGADVVPLRVTAERVAGADEAAARRIVARRIGMRGVAIA